MPDNPISSIPKLNEEEDRRRVRRALTDAEFARLLEVAAEQDVKNRGRFVSRYPVYLTAALTGLRRNELKQITWADIDLGTQTLRVRVKVGKSKREDFVPLHDQLIETLVEMRTLGEKATEGVFSSIPSIQTFYNDLARARRKWLSEAGSTEERRLREQSDFLKKEDAEGRVVDLHALRTTLGTNLALQGVAPQIAQKIMRHSNYKTTLAHYTALRMADTAHAVNQLPRVGELGRSHVLCTARRAAPSTARRAQNAAPACANVQLSCDEAELVLPAKADSQVRRNAALSLKLRHDAPREMDEAGDGNRTHLAGLGG